MEVSGWRHSPVFTLFTSVEKAPGAHWIGGWVGLTAGLDAVEKKKVSPPPWIEPRAARSPYVHCLRELHVSLLTCYWYLVVINLMTESFRLCRIVVVAEPRTYRNVHFKCRYLFFQQLRCSASVSFEMRATVKCVGWAWFYLSNDQSMVWRVYLPTYNVM
jgi:hypothetical protein